MTCEPLDRGGPLERSTAPPRASLDLERCAERDEGLTRHHLEPALLNDLHSLTGKQRLLVDPAQLGRDKRAAGKCLRSHTPSSVRQRRAPSLARTSDRPRRTARRSRDTRRGEQQTSARHGDVGPSSSAARRAFSARRRRHPTESRLAAWQDSPRASRSRRAAVLRRTGPSRSSVAIASAAASRSPQRKNPRLDEKKMRVFAQQLARKPLEPGQHRRVTDRH